MTTPNPSERCQTCGHELAYHTAQEGQCKKCSCMGWSPKHHLDSTQHSRGEHALFGEIQRLHRLLREGVSLVDQLECLACNSHPALYNQSAIWQQKVKKEIGT